jgi:hypothetical protein
MKTNQEMIDRLKQYLAPQGTEPVVRLFLNRATCVDKTCIDNAIDEFEKHMFFAGTLPLSNLERIGMMVLCDSAYMDEFLKED